MTALHHAAALGDVEALAMIIERDGLRMLEQQDRVRSLSRDQVCVVVPACWSSWVGLCVCVPHSAALRPCTMQPSSTIHKPSSSCLRRAPTSTRKRRCVAWLFCHGL